MGYLTFKKLKALIQKVLAPINTRNIYYRLFLQKVQYDGGII